MFVETTFQAITAVQTAFQIVLLFSLGRFLTIYCKFGGEYASSIRWTHQGGLWDMFRSSIGSYVVPRKMRYVMAGVLLVTALANMTSIITSRFIHQSEKLGEPQPIMSVSNQYVSKTGHFSLAGWTAYTRDGNIANAMMSMINAPENTPNKTGKVYNARTFDYDITCDAASVILPSGVPENLPNTCMSLLYTATSPAFTGIWGNETTIKGNGKYSYIGYGDTTPTPTELSPVVMLQRGNLTCSMMDFVSTMLFYPGNGTSSLPTTDVTKCWTYDGEMVVLSMSTVRFYSTLDSFNSTATALFGDNELFREVGIYITNDTFPVNVTRTATFAEIRLVGSSLEVACCMKGLIPESNTPTAICTYNIVNVIVSRTREYDPAWSAKIGSIANQNISSTIMSIKHLQKGTRTPLSTANIKDNTYIAADIFSRLGVNFHVDWKTGQLLVVYNVSDVRKGYEAPLWLIVVVGAMVTICGVVVGWTYTFDAIHTDSFYGIVTNKLIFHRQKPKKMLTRFRFHDGLHLNEGAITYHRDLPMDDQDNSTAMLSPEWK